MSKKDNNKAERFSNILNKLYEQEGIKYEKVISDGLIDGKALYIVSKKREDAKDDSDRLYGINKIYLYSNRPDDIEFVVENKIPIIYSAINAQGSRDNLSINCWNEIYIPYTFTMPDGTEELKYVPQYNHDILDCAKEYDKKEIRFLNPNYIAIKEKDGTNSILKIASLSSTEVETEKFISNFNDLHIMYDKTINIRTIKDKRIINETIKNGEITDRKILYGKIVFQNNLFYIVLNNKALRIYNLFNNEMLYELEDVKDIEELKDLYTDNSDSSNLYDYIGIIFKITNKNKKKQLLHIYDIGGRDLASLDKNEYDDLYYKGFIYLEDENCYDYGYTVEGIKEDEEYLINSKNGKFETIKANSPKQFKKTPKD